MHCTAVPHLLDKKQVTGETLAPLFMRKSHTVAHLKSSKMVLHFLFSTLFTELVNRLNLILSYFCSYNLDS